MRFKHESRSDSSNCQVIKGLSKYIVQGLTFWSPGDSLIVMLVDYLHYYFPPFSPSCHLQETDMENWLCDSECKKNVTHKNPGATWVIIYLIMTARFVADWL